MPPASRGGAGEQGTSFGSTHSGCSTLGAGAPLLETQTGGGAGRGFVVVWDCESDCSFDSLPGHSHDEKLKFMNFTNICAVCMPVELILAGAPADEIVVQSASHTWWRDKSEDGSNPVISLLDLFDSASLIVGYNCLAFDFPLVRRFYRPTDTFTDPSDCYLFHRSKTFDIMTRVRDATGKYYKLDCLLKLNGVPCKTGHGKNAIKLWNAGKRQELEDYCHNDVVVTAKLALLSNIKVAEESCVYTPCIGLVEQLLAVVTKASLPKY